MSDTRKNLRILILMLFGLIYILLLFTVEEGDRYFTIASGRDLLNGQFYHISHMAYNKPTLINHWLYAVILTFFDKLGHIGFIIWVMIQHAVLIYVSYKFLYRKTGDKFKSAIYPFITIICCDNYLFNTRPQIMTMIFLVLQIYLLNLYKETKENKYLIWLIPTYILAANMHGALFLYHIYIIIPFCFNEFRKNIKKLIDYKVTGMSFIYMLCGCVTPYGFKSTLLGLKAMFSKQYAYFDYPECRPILLSGNITASKGRLYFLVLLFILVILIKEHKINRYILFYSITIFLFCTMSLRHISIIYLSVLFLIPSLEDFINSKYVSKKGIVTLTVVCFLYYLVFFTATYLGSPKTVNIVSSKNHDMTYELRYVPEEIPKDKVVFSDYMVSGYLQYHGYTTTMDGRIELYDWQYFDSYFRLTDFVTYNPDTDEYDKHLTGSEIITEVNKYDTLVLNKKQKVNKIIKDTNKYKIIYTDDNYYIWQKK